MVDISAKEPSIRSATAEAFVRMAPATLSVLKEGGIEKGDALGTARIAGIMAAKKTSELIPLCHPISLTDVAVDLRLEDEGVLITASVKTRDRTGVEMEALVAASAAALTVYDMCKSVDKGISIEHVRLLAKTGGKSGDWIRQDG